MNFEDKTLEELMKLLPCSVEFESKQFDLNIRKGNKWTVSYIHDNKDKIVVDIEDVRFGVKEYLFKTNRSDKDLVVAVKSMLQLLHNNKLALSFIPRIHPFSELD